MILPNYNNKMKRNRDEPDSQTNFTILNFNNILILNKKS